MNQWPRLPATIEDGRRRGTQIDREELERVDVVSLLPLVGQPEAHGPVLLVGRRQNVDGGQLQCLSPSDSEGLGLQHVSPPIPRIDVGTGLPTPSSAGGVVILNVLPRREFLAR